MGDDQKKASFPHAGWPADFKREAALPPQWAEELALKRALPPQYAKQAKELAEQARRHVPFPRTAQQVCDVLAGIRDEQQAIANLQQELTQRQNALTKRRLWLEERLAQITAGIAAPDPPPTAPKETPSSQMSEDQSEPEPVKPVKSALAPKDWLRMTKRKYPRKDEKLSKYAERLIKVMEVARKAGEVERVWSKPTMARRLRDKDEDDGGDYQIGGR